ncbi:TetR/AcrR family transcriptional regulator [Streptomyces sp. NPDC048603]|uniref:TetR/AcrR family transcriptional regulator n=1 Tax=Streptomyces sp. NPDC048603 TaxID=3365577 RepID=UPI00371CCBE8
MGRTSTARERLLDAACALVLERGYTAVGVAEICARADVKKGSFYHFFPSKQALTVEAVNAHWAAQRPSWTALLAAPGPGEDRLRGLFEQQAAAQRAARAEHGSVHGCLFGNLALEVSGRDEVVQARLAEIFDEQIDLVHAALPGRSRDTARAVLAQLEGMVLFAKLSDDPSLLDGLWDRTALLLRA